MKTITKEMNQQFAKDAEAALAKLEHKRPTALPKEWSQFARDWAGHVGGVTQARKIAREACDLCYKLNARHEEEAK